jgi:N-acetylmuramoyl-L-alanine amidase
VTFILIVSQRAAALFVLAVLVGATAYYAGKAAVMTLAPLRDLVSGRTIVIDPGHGGPDAGARGKNGAVEKDINLHIAQELKVILNRVAVHTMMTREGDHDLIQDGEDISGSRKREELRRRADLANSTQADLFISIHANSFPEPQWSGAQVFYNPRSEESRILAEHIQTELVRRLGPNTRRARPADLYVLRQVKVPAALVEVGFLSNPREERLLLDAEYRVRVADAIYHGIVSYFLARSRQEKHATEDDWGLVRKVAVAPPDSAQVSPKTPDDMVLYFGGPTNFEDSLMPEIRTVPGLSTRSRTDVLRAIMEGLIFGPGTDSILQPTIPKGTVLRGVRLEGDIAIVDLSAEFVTNHWGGSRCEEITVYSIVNSLTELGYVKKVKLLVEGRALTTISGHLAIEGPLERDLSIVDFRT